METATYPVAPATTPLRGTLLDTATVTDAFRWLDGDNLFESYNCMKFQTEAGFCTPTSKTFANNIGWQDGQRFAAYGGAVCKAVGLDMADMESQVRRVFEQGESTAVEQALMKYRFVANADTTYLTVPTMNAPSTATTGGTLAAGTYRAVITATTVFGETTVSNEVSQVTTGATSTITFNWGNLSGESGYRIYVTAVGGGAGTETHLIDRPADTTSYVWTGTPARGTATPPTTNTAAINAAVGEWNAPTDITPAAGAVSPKVGMALLEGHAGANYVGAPTLHIPRSIASILADGAKIEFDGSMLRTPLGSKVAAGSGYDYPNTGPTGAAAAVGEKWLYATGEVVVGRSALEVRQVMAQSTNEVFVLGERGYILAVDCYTAAVRVTVTA